MKRMLTVVSMCLVTIAAWSAWAQAGGCCGMGMGACSPGGSGKAALLLLALAAGFWVLSTAESQANRLKLVGRIVGWLILIAAACGLLCSAMFGMCKMKMCGKGGMMGCGPMGSSTMAPCPMGGPKMGHGMVDLESQGQPAEKK